MKRVSRQPKSVYWVPLGYLVLGSLWIVFSDTLLARVFGTSVTTLAAAGVLKGLFFVTVTALMLYVALRAAAARGEPVPGDGADALQAWSVRQAWQPALLFVIGAVIVSGIAYGFYRLQAEAIERQAIGELRTATRSVTAQVQLLREARRDALAQVAGSRHAARALAAWIDGGGEDARRELRQHLELLRAAGGYESIVLHDVDGRALLSTGDAPPTAALDAQIGQAIGSGAAVATRPVVDDEARAVFHIVVPLVVGERRGAPVIGVMAAALDLAPGVAGLLGPATPSESGARVFILQREPGPPLALAAADDAPVVRALPGADAERVSGLVRVPGGAIVAPGLDGTPSVMVAEGIEGTTWVAVAAVPRARLTAGLRQLMLVTGALLVTGLVACAGVALLWWRGERRYLQHRLAGAEQRIQTLLQHFAAATRHANDAVLLMDGSQRIIEANERAAELYGHDREALKRLGIADLMPATADARAAFEAQARRLRDDGSAVFEAENLRADGSLVPVEISARRFEIGGKLYFQSIVRDISARLAMEQALKEREATFRALADVSPVGIFRANASGECTYVNNRWCEITGLAREQALGLDCFSGVTPADRPHVMGSWRDALRRKAVFAAEYRIADAAGRLTWVLGQSVRESHDSPDAGFVGTLTDISDLKDLEQRLEWRVAERTSELRSAKDRAEQADRAKSSFLAHMSHELRTPLNSIIGFTSALMEQLAGPLNADQARQLTAVQDSARHLLALINDLLDISRIEAGRMRIELQPVDVARVIERVVARLEGTAHDRSLALDVELAADLGRIDTDERRLEQIVSNLLGNAIKFTDEGHVAVKATRTATGVSISVTDTGIGIRADDLSGLFRPFSQVAGDTRQLAQGAGLGLAISRRLAELLGGRLTVHSVYGHGSVFAVALPQSAPAPLTDET